MAKSAGRLVGAAVSSRLRGLSRAALSFWDAAKRENIPRVFLILVLLHLTFATLVFVAEHATFVPASEDDAVPIRSFPIALWWSIVTMTTVGYGDFTPVTPLGRVLASLLMIGSAATLAMFTASFASMLVSTRLREAQGLTALKVKNHFVIIGWNRHAERLIDNLVAASTRRPQIVLINQLPPEQQQEIGYKHRSINLLTMRGDATLGAVLERANIREASGVIILSDTTAGEATSADDRVLFVALAVRDANPEVKISAEIQDVEKRSAIRQAGVDEVVVTDEETPFFLASTSMAPGLARAAHDLLTPGSGRELRRIEFPRELRGQTFRQARAHYRRESGALLIGIISEAAVLTIGDVLGSTTDWVDEFIRSAFRQSGSDVVAQSAERTQAILAPPDDYVIGSKDWGIVIAGAER